MSHLTKATSVTTNNNNNNSALEAAVSSIITTTTTGSSSSVHNRQTVQIVNNPEGPGATNTVIHVQEVEEEVELGYHQHQEEDEVEGDSNSNNIISSDGIGTGLPQASHQVIVTSEAPTQPHEGAGSGSMASITGLDGQHLHHHQLEDEEELQQEEDASGMTIIPDILPTHHEQQQQTQRTQMVNSAGTVVAVTTSVVPQQVQQRVVQKQVVVQNQTPMSQKFQDVRVDNWGNYCLQRLQVMYDRGDFCDLTLQFHTGQTLKVHRVVVNLCTEYFANLERMYGLIDGTLVLQKDVEYQAMVTIIKFFYTGKLEVRGNQFNEVYRTVKLMNITILIKLLEAHAKKPIAQAKKEPTRPIVFKQAVEIGRPMQKGQGQNQPSYSGTTALSFQGAGGTTKTLQVTTPGAKLPPGVKTKTVLARVQPQSVRIAQQSPAKAGNQKKKKLPIWKERKFSPANAVDPLMTEKWPIKDEPARPTRFEWGDPEDDPSFLSPVVNHSLMDKQKHNNSSRKVEDIFDVVKNQNLAKRNLMNQDKNQIKVEQPPAKMIKLEQSALHQTRSEEINTVHHTSDSDHVNLTEETVEEEVHTSEAEVPQVRAPILKPALKSQSHIRMTPMVGSNDPNLGNMGKNQEMPTTSGSSRGSVGQAKSVRFAPEIEKECSKTIEVSGLFNSKDENGDHSKIVAEILKKYPDIVKDKQNIKLKIVQKGGESGSSKDKAKVSYIVLKSTSAPSDSLGALLLKKPSQATSHKAFWDNSEKPEKLPSGAENVTGPWLCEPCGGGEETPMAFESYYTYRKHLVDIHAERIDARICEYCGQKASKRNLLMHHLYTKHGVPPPKNMNFPSCDKCDYVALSESLLNKHKLTHDATKEFGCHICTASFKSSLQLQSHISANLHRSKATNIYECPYCRKGFVRNVNLKTHIRQQHKEIARLEEMDDSRSPLDESIANRSSASMSSGSGGKKRQFPSILDHRARVSHQGHSLEILPHDGTEGQQVSLMTADGHTIEILQGLDPHTMTMPMTFVPSSEAEAMTNVASSIAASLGLEAQGVHGTTEYMTGVTSDGSPAVYIMDNSQPAVEVDMSAMGLTADGTMIYDGDDPTGQGQFIVQDIHGNQFRKITGIDETGKPVIFFQLSEENGQVTMAPAMLDDGMQMQGTGSVFVSSGMTMPVTVSSDGTGQQAQVLLATSGHDGTVYEMVSANQEHHHHHHQQVVLTSGPVDGEAQHHHHYHHQEVLPEQIEHGQTVQELHIVLDQNENSQDIEGQQHDVVHDDGSLMHHQHEHQHHQHEEHVQEQYEENGEVIEGVIQETVTADEEDNHHHHTDEQDVGALEVQTVQEVSQDNLGENEDSSNIMIVEEVTAEDQGLEIQETQEGQIIEENESEQIQIHQDDTQELEIENTEVETQEMVSGHEEGVVHMVGEEEEHHQHHTQIIDEEMQLVEEVTGETLSMVEEEVGQEEDEMETS